MKSIFRRRRLQKHALRTRTSKNTTINSRHTSHTKHQFRNCQNLVVLKIQVVAKILKIAKINPGAPRRTSAIMHF